MFRNYNTSSISILRCHFFPLPPPLHLPVLSFHLMEPHHPNSSSSSFTSYSHSMRSGGGGIGGMQSKDFIRSRPRGRGNEGSGKDKIDALGRLLTRILRHMASELKLNMRGDGFVKVQDLLKLDMKTFANIPLWSHSIEDIREAVGKDNKQRFSLVEDGGELWIRANQGHTIMTVETEQLLKPIVSTDEVPVCVHGTYKKNLQSILEQGLKRMQRLHVHFSCGLPTDGEVISGMRRDVNLLIFLDVRKALEGAMKLYISDNKVILTEGFNGVVPAKYFQKIESSLPDKEPCDIFTLLSDFALPTCRSMFQIAQLLLVFFSNGKSIVYYIKMEV